MTNLHEVQLVLDSRRDVAIHTAQHHEFYPLYETELTEALDTLKDYCKEHERLAKSKQVKELVEFIQDKHKELRNLIPNEIGSAEPRSYWVFPDYKVNDIIPIKYGTPILKNLFEGANIIMGSIRNDIGQYAHCKAILHDYKYFFNEQRRYGVSKPDITMFYPDFEEQDNGVTTDRDVNMPMLTDTEAVKELPNGDYEIRVYLIYDRNRPRTSQGLGGRRYIIKDGVNRYKKALEQYAKDKQEWYNKALETYRQDINKEREKAEHALSRANQALTALDTILMPISILSALVGSDTVTCSWNNTVNNDFKKLYSYVVGATNSLVTLNQIKYSLDTDIKTQQLETLNSIAGKYTHYYGHQTRASILRIELNKVA